jgi:hypothetical protein
MSTSYYTLTVNTPEHGDIYPVTTIVDSGSSSSLFQWSPWVGGAPLLRQIDIESGRPDPVATATFSVSEEGRTMVEWGASSVKQPVEAFLAQDGSGLCVS